MVFNDVKARGRFIAIWGLGLGKSNGGYGLFFRFF